MHILLHNQNSIFASTIAPHPRHPAFMLSLETQDHHFSSHCSVKLEGFLCGSKSSGSSEVGNFILIKSESSSKAVCKAGAFQHPKIQSIFIEVPTPGALLAKWHTTAYLPHLEVQRIWIVHPGASSGEFWAKTGYLEEWQLRPKKCGICTQDARCNSHTQITVQMGWKIVPMR
jgi:hypothetical protein